MATWRLAESLKVLRDEVNARWPNRSKASDGTIGDPAHASRKSDHNPSPEGVVRAMDITAAGIDPHWYAEHIRMLGASGHVPLGNHGYVIWNRRAAYQTNGWRWVTYTGSNPHTSHIHVSVGRDAARYDSRAPWRIARTDPNRLELTVGQYEDIVGLLVEIRNALLGHDDQSRDQSIYWNTRYLRGELLSGDNLRQLREILDRYGDPQVTVMVREGDDDPDGEETPDAVLVVSESEDERERQRRAEAQEPPADDRRAKDRRSK
jgi:hypothetical protein